VEGEVVKINTLARSFTLRTPDRKEIQCTPEDINRETAAPAAPEPSKKELIQQQARTAEKTAAVQPSADSKEADNTGEKSGSAKRRRSRNRNRSSSKGKADKPKETP